MIHGIVVMIVKIIGQMEGQTDKWNEKYTHPSYKKITYEKMRPSNCLQTKTLHSWPRPLVPAVSYLSDFVSQGAK